MVLGSFPELSLKEARERRDDARKLLNKGVDPGEQAIQKRMHEIEAGTVAELIDEYISKWAKRHKKSWKEDERILKKEALPRWGNRKAAEITRRDVIRLLDRIVDRGSPISANRTFEIIRRMFRFAIEQDIMATTPCFAVRPPAKNRKRYRVLSDNEIRLFWANADKAEASRPVQLALKFQLVTAQRRMEVAAAEWAEMDAESGWWTIPAQRAKGGRPNRVPLSAMAIDILSELKELAGDSRYVFPSTAGDGPIKAGAVTRAVARNRDTFGIPHFVPHDLRRTAATGITSMGVPRLVLSKVLGHVDGGGATHIYDVYSYEKEKRQALDAWGRKLETIFRGGKTNVVTLIKQ